MWLSESIVAPPMIMVGLVWIFILAGFPGAVDIYLDIYFELAFVAQSIFILVFEEKNT